MREAKSDNKSSNENIEKVLKQVYGNANSKKQEFEKNYADKQEALKSKYDEFQDLEQLDLDSNSNNIKQYSKLIGPFLGWIGKLIKEEQSDNSISNKIADKKIGGIELGNMKLMKPVGDVVSNILLETSESGMSHKANAFFRKLWEDGKDHNKIDKVLSGTICQRIVDYVKKDGNESDILSALDALIFSTQILPVPVPDDQIPAQWKDRQGWAKYLIEEVLNSYTEKLKNDAIGAINEQNFSFRDSNGNILPESEIKDFYKNQTPENFQIKDNLERIREIVKDLLDGIYTKLYNDDEFKKLKSTTIDQVADKDNVSIEVTGEFKDVIKDKEVFSKKAIISQYLIELDGVGNASNKETVKPWAQGVVKGAEVIKSTLDKIQDEVKNLIEAKVREKTDYLADLLKISNDYEGKPLPSFLIEPSDNYTEIGLLYKTKSADKNNAEDPLFEGLDDNQVLERLEKFRINFFKDKEGRGRELNERVKKEIEEAGFVVRQDGEGSEFFTIYSKKDNDPEKAKHIKEFFLSAPGRPRQVPNIYWKEEGKTPQQIYAREFLAAYQSALVNEVTRSGDEKKNTIQVYKCYFFTGEGKTHTVSRITNHISYKNQADQILKQTSNNQMVVMDFNLQNDDIGKIKEQIQNEINKEENQNKKLSFVFQMDEDPHMSAEIKQFFYKDVSDFLKDKINENVNTISTISISGTPKQSRFDHLINKVDKKFANDNFESWWQDKKKKWTDKEQGKTYRALDNLKQAYGENGLQKVLYKFEKLKLIDSIDSVQDRIAENLKSSAKKSIDSTKGTHIQYLLPDLSPNDSALLFAPARLEEMANKFITDENFQKGDEFNILLPPVSDAIAKDIRNKAKIEGLSDENQKSYINFLEKKKIITFKKQDKGWKLESVSEGREEVLDNKDNTKKNSLCFYDKNTFVGGDYGKYSRDITAFYIDNLNGTKFNSDDLAQMIARNRSIDLRQEEKVNEVTSKCKLYYSGEGLEDIKENAKKDLELLKKEFDILNTVEKQEISKKLTEYKKLKKQQIYANDNDLTPLKKIIERLNSIKINEEVINQIIFELDEYAVGAHKKLSKPNRIDGDEEADLNALNHILGLRNLSLLEEDKNTANSYVKEYVEAERARQNRTKEGKGELIKLPLFNESSSDELSRKLEPNAKASDKINFDDCKIGGNVFSSRRIFIEDQSGKGSLKDKVDLLQKKLGLSEDANLRPNDTIIDLISYYGKFSRHYIKQEIRQNDKLKGLISKTLNNVDLDVKSFATEVLKVRDNLESQLKKKEKNQQYSSDKFKDIKIKEIKNGLVTVKSKIQYLNNNAETKEIDISFDIPKKDENIYEIARKETKEIQKKVFKLESLRKNLQEIKRNFSNSSKDDPNIQKINFQDFQGSNDLLTLNTEIELLEKDIRGIKEEGEKSSKQEAEQFLPNSHIKKISPYELKNYIVVNDKKIKNLDSLSAIKIIDDSNLLFSSDDIVTKSQKMDDTYNTIKKISNKEYLIRKLLSSIQKDDFELPKGDYSLDIVVEKDGKVSIKTEGLDNNISIDTSLKPFQEIENSKEDKKLLLAYSEAEINRKLNKKRQTDVKSEVPEMKLYYVKPGADTDGCIINEKNANTTIPHLMLKFKEEEKTRVVDVAFSKSANKDALRDLVSMEEKSLQYVREGYNVQSEWKSKLKKDQVNGIDNADLKAMLENSSPIPINLEKAVNNFSNALERKDDDKGNHLVKLDFVVGFDEDSKKIIIPKDAPRFRFVHVNGTGAFGSNALKLKFAIDDKTGQLSFEGVFEKVEEDNKINFKKLDPITPEQQNLINKMKVVATRQVVNDKEVKLDKIIYLNGDKEKSFELDNIAVTTDSIVKNQTNLFGNKDIELEFKPNSLVLHPEAKYFLPQKEIMVKT